MALTTIKQANKESIDTVVWKGIFNKQSIDTVVWKGIFNKQSIDTVVWKGIFNKELITLEQFCVFVHSAYLHHITMDDIIMFCFISCSVHVF